VTQDFAVDGLVFSFGDDWHVGKYDQWSFYRNQFSRMRNGIKAVDLLAVSPDGTAFLIEAKDYRRHPRTKPSGLDEDVAAKLFDTLAALLPARVNAKDASEKKLAERALRARNLRVVFHLEQPRTHSKLFPRIADPAKIQQKLRSLLKPVDAHPRVVETAHMQDLPWQVR
jgi:hypothetical protein